MRGGVIWGEGTYEGRGHLGGGVIWSLQLRSVD